MPVFLIFQVYRRRFLKTVFALWTKRKSDDSVVIGIFQEFCQFRILSLSTTLMAEWCSKKK